MKVLSIIGLLTAMSACTFGQTLLPFQNVQLPARERAIDLTSRLTIEEKAQLMLDESPAIPRLGIRRFSWWSEALHGITNQDNVTVFPEPIGMAASFDDALVGQVFEATSDEIRARYNEQMRQGLDPWRFHGLSAWTPNVNIFRDPRWGRGQETYGEDPYLTTRMGLAAVHGLQGPSDSKHIKVLACAKHFALHSGPEWARQTDNVKNVEPRDFWETYMPAFKALVQEGGVRQVMCAYQRVDDEPCCGSTRLLQTILRRRWGFDGIVCSDCGALADFYTGHQVSTDGLHAGVLASRAGTDVECGFNYAYSELPEAVRLGLVDSSEVDEHVIRLLTARFELGEMDDPETVEWSHIPASVVGCPAHQQLALSSACESMVLLQNRGSVLPLKSNVGKIAVIGPNSDNPIMMWGNYNGYPSQTVTILDGIRRRLGTDRLVYLEGCDHVRDQTLESYYDQCSIDGQTGFRGTFWNNGQREGMPITVTYEHSPIQVTTAGQHSFADGVRIMDFSALYETVFRPQQSGTVLLDVEGCSYFEVFINGESKAQMRTRTTTDTRTTFEAKAGQEYHIEIRYAQIEFYDANLKVRIGHESPIDYQQIVNKINDCPTVIFVGGISSRLEGEEMPIDLPGFQGGDRTDIELPQVQRQLLKALHEAGKRVILVNCSGGAMALEPETESCDAILQAWYSGQEGGDAVAQVLFGEVCPSGKLPVTFYRSTSQLPDYRSYSMQGRTYRYMSNPLFAFGYGLSYTAFSIGQAHLSDTTLKLENEGEAQVQLRVPIQNMGQYTGTEVLQVYVHSLDDTDGPFKTLRNFRRINLAPKEQQEATFILTARSFEFYDEQSGKMCVRPGRYEVLYGNSSRDEDLKSVEICIVSP